jgi:hypothetical protein
MGEVVVRVPDTLFTTTREGHMAATRTARKTTTRSKSQPKKAAPTVEPKVEQTKLSDLEHEIVTTLKSEGVEADAVTKDLLKRWDTVCDEGRLQFYTAGRYGSAHDSDWISPALVARIQRAVAKERPGAAD